MGSTLGCVEAAREHPLYLVLCRARALLREPFSSRGAMISLRTCSVTFNSFAHGLSPSEAIAHPRRRLSLDASGGDRRGPEDETVDDAPIVSRAFESGAYSKMVFPCAGASLMGRPDRGRAPVAEVLLHRVDRVAADACPRVVKGRQNAMDLNGVVQQGVDVLDGLDDLPHAHQRQEVACHGNDDAVRRDQCVLVHER